jgi:hypothetical protein
MSVGTAHFDGLWKDSKSKLFERDLDMAQLYVLSGVMIVLAIGLSVLGHFKGKAFESGFERTFERVGRTAATHPLKFIAGGIFFIIAMSSGTPLREDELDPGKLWVPEGSLALDHQEYVKSNWKSEVRFNVLIYEPKGGGNILTPKSVRAVSRLEKKFYDIEVDGSVLKDFNDDDVSKYSGKWSFRGNAANNVQRKCFAPGVECRNPSIMALFDYKQENVAAVTDAEVLAAFNAYDAAQKDASVSITASGNTFTITKKDSLDDMVGGIIRESNKIVGAASFRSQFPVTNVESLVSIKKGDKAKLDDPIAQLWEADAVCIANSDPDGHPETDKDCSQNGDPDLKIYGFFMRSMGDEFGKAIRGDVMGIGIAFMLIIGYLIPVLGKRDSVHAMVSLSLSCVLGVGGSIGVCYGLAGFFGVKNNPLVNNIPFLAIGLGVDDAFVIVASFNDTYKKMGKDTPLVERVAKAVGSSGLSVTITSFTDALAFIIGSMTVLPALAGFCLHGGFCILALWFLQFMIFIPCLTLNARRSEDNRFECLCCIQAKEEHDASGETQQGCCLLSKIPDGLLRNSMNKLSSNVLRTLPARVGVTAAFFILFVVSIVTLPSMKTDFQIDWFFPDDSYVNDFVDKDKQYFDDGFYLQVYTNGVDYDQQKSSMDTLGSYIRETKYAATGSSSDWWLNFRSSQTLAQLSAQGATFWNNLRDWYKTPAASGFRSNVHWRHSDCNNALSTTCDPTKGIKEARSSFVCKRDVAETGKERWTMLMQMRKDVKAIMTTDSDMQAFPFSSDGLFWEENGIIDFELVRNLIICGGVIIAIISLMIPNPRVSITVILVIFGSIVDVLALAHHWGCTINSVVTIYLLISVGLAVDYSAHIGHVFLHSKGLAVERAHQAFTNIGPSVFHAIISTVLAVLVLARSKSYVFVTFFKLLFLVTFVAGSHGLLLLPAVLSFVGGDLPCDEETDAPGPEKVDNSVVSVEKEGA